MKYNKPSSENKSRIAKFFRAANLAAENTSRSNAFAARLFRGEISLTLTFWTFSLSLPIIGHLLFSRIIYPAIDLEATSGTTILAIYASLVISYTAFISISLYRSAEHYTGKFGTRVSSAARIFSIGFFAFALIYTAYLYAAWSMSVGA